MPHRLRIVIFGALVAFSTGPRADEGMWTTFNFPSASVRDKYGVSIDEAWLKRLQRATTRHEGGCTGSFISPDGLVLTNHHCVLDCLADLSSSGNDVVADGYHARTRAEEKACPGEMLSVLVESENITEKVGKAIAGLSDARANEIRKQTLSKLEAQCAEASKKDRKSGPLACESVSLYQGGQYFLYKYRRYDDVRLVFSPHDAIAAFGGDPDNFNFPRWSLDFSLLRVYRDGRPASTPDHLTWRIEGPAANEPVFVMGHPGATNRLYTVSQLKFQRDVSVPSFLMRNSELRGRMIQWSKTGEEPARIIQENLLIHENTLKVYRGFQNALLNDALFTRKASQQEALQAKADTAAASAWGDIDRAIDLQRQIYDRYLYLESAAGFNSKLFMYARQLVRGAAERAKSNELRLREYAQSNLPKIEGALLAATPVHPEYEQLTLSFSLDKLREALGPDDPVTRQLMNTESPDSLARKLIEGTKLADPAVRKALWEGGQKALDASNDPMIALAKQVDAPARALRKTYEDEIQAPIATAQERIARARFAALGTSIYPDANFTLRVSYGAVKGWKEKGEDIQPFTQLSRLYERTTGKLPFQLPKVWLDKKDTLDPTTPFNFVTTNDIVGGNSGSPIVDAQGHLVGLAFDGNIHSLEGSYGYDETRNRAIAVHPRIIMTALRDVYGATSIADEIAKK
jgi:hypothetical protein